MGILKSKTPVEIYMDMARESMNHARQLIRAAAAELPPTTEREHELHMIDHKIAVLVNEFDEISAPARIDIDYTQEG